MGDGIPAETLDGTAKALRYAVWHAGNDERAAAGVDPADWPPCPVADDGLPALAAPLAALVTAAWRAVAEQGGAAGLAEQNRVARASLESVLERVEIDAALAGVEAEMRGAKGSPDGILT